MQHVRKLLRSQVQCVLATATRQGQPSTALMAYAYTDDMHHVFMASSVSSRKCEDMLANPRVSILFDNRTGNLADHGDGMLVTASGHASLLTFDSGAESAAARLIERNPNQAGFMAQEGDAVLAVAVETYAVVVGYGKPTLVQLPTDQSVLRG